MTDLAGTETDRWAGTAPRRLVHRRAIAEVYVTGCERSGSHRATVWAQWPRYHQYYCPNNAYGPQIAVETLRQSVELVHHALLGIDSGTHFVLRSVWVEAADGAYPVAGLEPLELEVDVSWNSDDVARGVTEWTLGVKHNDRLVATGGGTMSVLSAAVYRRIRSSVTVGSTPPEAWAGARCRPEDVGASRVQDVCVSCGSDEELRLVVDETHPIYFDHPLDHVPGMLLFEAGVQAAHLAGVTNPARVRAELGRFVDLPVAEEVTLRVENGTEGLAVALALHGQSIGTVTVR